MGTLFTVTNCDCLVVRLTQLGCQQAAIGQYPQSLLKSPSAKKTGVLG